MQRPYSFASTLEKKKQHKNQEVRQVVGVQHEDIGVHAEYKHYICVSVGGGGWTHGCRESDPSLQDPNNSWMQLIIFDYFSKNEIFHPI